MADSHSGGCQCGAVRYRITGPLGHSGICHCRMCQKAGGNFGLVLLTTAVNQLEWTRGKAAEFSSTPVTVRGFCAKCGTPLYMHEAGDTNYELTVGSLDTPDNAPPVDEVGIESKRAWFIPPRTTARRKTWQNWHAVSTPITIRTSGNHRAGLKAVSHCSWHTP